MLDPPPRESKHAHFRWSKADIESNTRKAVRLGICEARRNAVMLFQDPFLQTSNPTRKQADKFLRVHGFQKKRKPPTPNFDQPDYGNY